jgi:hypothetical protein
LNYDDDSSSVGDKDSVDDEDDDYHNNYDDDNDDKDEEAAAVRNNTKRRHGTMEEEGGGGGGEEDNDEEDVVVTWLSMKGMSKMSDGELCSHFNTKLQKKESSICQNRQCDCLAILRNQRICLFFYCEVNDLVRPADTVRTELDCSAMDHNIISARFTPLPCLLLQ